MITSSAVIMPRSPWLASPGWTKKAGVPVDASVAAIFLATWPDLPMPVTMTRPLAARIRSTAAMNPRPRPSWMAAARPPMPPASASSVRSADSMNEWRWPGVLVALRFDFAMFVLDSIEPVWRRAVGHHDRYYRLYLALDHHQPSCEGSGLLAAQGKTRA